MLILSPSERELNLPRRLQYIFHGHVPATTDKNLALCEKLHLGRLLADSMASQPIREMEEDERDMISNSEYCVSITVKHELARLPFSRS